MNIERYNKIFLDLFEAEESELNEAFNFGVAPNWDSLAHMELIAQLEDEFDIEIDLNDAKKISRYEDILTILTQKYHVKQSVDAAP